MQLFQLRTDGAYHRFGS